MDREKTIPGLCYIPRWQCDKKKTVEFKLSLSNLSIEIRRYSFIRPSKLLILMFFLQEKNSGNYPAGTLET